MSRENVEIVRRTFEAYERGDIAAMLADAHPDLITHRATMPMADTYHGHEGFLQAFIDWIEDFEEFSVTAEEFIDASDTQVLVHVRERALGSGSNVPVEIDGWFVYTLDAGKSCDSTCTWMKPRPSKPCACRSSDVTRGGVRRPRGPGFRPTTSWTPGTRSFYSCFGRAERVSRAE